MKKCSPYQNHVHESACSHIIMDTELYIELYVVKNMVVFSGVFFCIPEKTESITDSFVNPLSYVRSMLRILKMKPWDQQ